MVVWRCWRQLWHRSNICFLELKKITFYCYFPLWQVSLKKKFLKAEPLTKLFYFQCTSVRRIQIQKSTHNIYNRQYHVCIMIICIFIYLFFINYHALVLWSWGMVLIFFCDNIQIQNDLATFAPRVAERACTCSMMLPCTKIVWLQTYKGLFSSKRQSIRCAV